MASISEPLVSIVTPFYNTAQYLEECIKSVLKQTYRNWEYILVNNCSTDGSQQIAEKYAKEDTRVRLIQEVEFVGQVENYNRSLKYISPKSKYCKIVQADDWIYPRCIEEMVSVAESRDNVGLVSSYYLSGNCPICEGGLPLSKGPVYKGREIAKAQLLGITLFGSATGVMYSSNVVRSREHFFSSHFPHFEDAEVCFEILRNHDFGFVPQILTFSRSDNQSIMGKLDPYEPFLLSQVMFVYLFGEEYLDNETLTLRTREIEGVYYDLLARRVFNGRGKCFWDFHINALRAIEKKISYSRIALHVLLFLFDSILNPKKSIETIMRRMMHSKKAAIISARRNVQ